MDLLLVLRDALASSLVGGLLAAMDAKKLGQEVGVVFTQEALAAAAKGSFQWPRELSGQDMRLLMADRGAELGLPILGRGEGRQLDAKALISRAREAGVKLYACPNWSALLGLQDRLPHDMEALDAPAFQALVRDATKVVGAL